MSDEVTETTTESWGSRLGGSFKGILVGCGLVIAAAALLWWNEGRSVHRAEALTECQGKTVTVPAAVIDSKYEGLPVHVYGKATVAEELRDPYFPSVKIKAIRLQRKVEMYQWQESTSTKTHKKTGGSTTTEKTYSYSKDWSGQLVNSSSFHKPEGHLNPAAMAVTEAEFTASKVSLGAFAIPADMLSGLSASMTLAPEVPAMAAQPVAAASARPASGSTISLPPANAANPTNSIITLPPENPSSAQAAPAPQVNSSAAASEGALSVNGKIFRVVNGIWYCGVDPNNPQIGDLRITHRYVPEQDVSIVAVQTGDTFTAYTAKNGQKVRELHSGIQTLEGFFTSSQNANKTMTWLLRFAGFLLMFFGFKMIFAPLEVLADVIPFIGNIVGMGTGLVSGMLAAGGSLLVMGIAWLVYRPILGICALVIAAGLIIMVLKGKKKAAN